MYERTLVTLATSLGLALTASLAAAQLASESMLNSTLAVLQQLSTPDADEE